MNEDEVRGRMDGVLNVIKEEISSVRAGRASASMVENVFVSVYGGASKMKIVELASINTPDTQTIVIEPWDKSIIGEIRKGIQEANLGYNPSIDNNILRISIPPMTTEDRERYVKLLKNKIENGRVMVRQIRSDVMRDIKNAFEKKEVSEDERLGKEKRLQEMTDEYIKNIEVAGEAKEKELLG